MTAAGSGTGALPPGRCIGILGGGQLGRMTALAAARLGYRTHIFCHDPDEPAAQVATATTCAGFDDEAALDRFAAAVDVVTLEFENLPVAALRRLSRQVPVRPGPGALEIAQDRALEKTFLAAHDVPVSPFAVVSSAATLAAALQRFDGPTILKTARFGYDGKGQLALTPDADPGECWRRLAAGRAVLEARQTLACEISVITARTLSGTLVAFPPAENIHRDGILRQSEAPARLPADLLAAATAMAGRIATALDIVGLLAVEFFVTHPDRRLLVNEIAPRPHNSGHWTMDGCAVSQFEQLVRVVCALPPGDPGPHSRVVMTNLIGDEANRWPAWLGKPGHGLHLYGKAECRPGRKMGHVNRIMPRPDTES